MNIDQIDFFIDSSNPVVEHYEKSVEIMAHDAMKMLDMDVDVLGVKSCEFMTEILLTNDDIIKISTDVFEVDQRMIVDELEYYIKSNIETIN